MRKLFNLKKWLTIPETAKHLSIAFGEDVSESDVLRLALDGHLKLSVNLVNGTKAKLGKIVDMKGTQWIVIPNVKPFIDNENTLDKYESVISLPDDLKRQIEEIKPKERKKFRCLIRSIHIVDDKFINLNKEVTSIEGVWDLPMIGGEALEIEHKYQKHTNGPSVTSSNLEGGFLQRDETTIAQLQESFDYNEYQKGSKAHLEKIKQKIALDNLPDDEAQNLLIEHKADREEYLKRKKENPNADYYPAGCLPEDAVLVVRTDELRRFENVLSEDESKDKPLQSTERNTLLTIIAALCKYEGIDPSDRNTTSQIVQMTEDLGAPISDDTIRAILKKIPNAVDSRTK